MAGRGKKSRRTPGKHRQAARAGAGETGGESTAGTQQTPGPAAQSKDDLARGPAARSRDDLARERLVSLREGERPPAVTVAAVVAVVIALANIIGFLAGIEIGDTKPRAIDVGLTAGLMLVMAGGMWYARYWAVLGFQTILAILIVLMSLLLVGAQNVVSALVAVAIIAAAGTLFWFLVKSLARIQMPDRRPPDV